MENRLTSLFNDKSSDILNVYFTAGHPALEDTATIIQYLSDAGVDLIEVGVPYSDPMADGETIQRSSSIALKNGMTLQTLFRQIKTARAEVSLPLILMGYYNQMLQYGIERFLQDCQESGVDGLIIPDLPMGIYERDYQELFDQYNVKMTFLITPETTEDRIRQADALSSGFIYMVSKSSITGSASDISDSQQAYFERIAAMDLKSPRLIGFGIHDKSTYQTACANSHGAIIGSAFIRALEGDDSLENKVKGFIGKIR